MKPEARNSGILIQELEKELLIYDLAINKVFSLNETCAMVWAECNGRKTIAEIASILSRRTKGLVNEEVVWLALETLQKENLLSKNASILPNFNGLNRRQIIRKLGFASLVAFPVITSLVVPTAAMAQSGGGPVGPTLPVGFFGDCTSPLDVCDTGLYCRPCLDGCPTSACCSIASINPGPFHGSGYEICVPTISNTCGVFAGDFCCSGLAFEGVGTCLDPGQTSCRCD